MITTATIQGLRSYQEDRFYYYTYPNGNTFIAVMDGHGGVDVAEYCKSYFKKKIPFGNLGSNPNEYLRVLISELSSEITNSGLYAGTTLSIAYTDPSRQKVFIAVLGDSPIIIINDLVVDIGPDHNVRTNEAERQKAIERGGVFSYGYICDPNGNGLQMSRALGDLKMGGIISHEPEQYEVGLNNDTVIIVASDGLIDPSHEKTKSQIDKVVEYARRGMGARAITSRMTSSGARDNVTVVVWRARKVGKKVK